MTRRHEPAKISSRGADRPNFNAGDYSSQAQDKCEATPNNPRYQFFAPIERGQAVHI